MPSAANIKVDKQITSETASVDSASNQQNTPIRQAIVIIEHKIRNLEKRKAKLESYRELQASGKDLNADQRVAVAKYDEVVQTLEFARDLCKQFQGIALVADKEAKKIARKDAAARSQQELAKVREVLLVQDALTQLGQDTVREDFLLGRNGAVVLMETDLKLLDDLYPEVSPKHEAGLPTNFTSQVQSAAEHLLAVVDGKQKDAFGSTYVHIKEVIGKVHESGYLDQAITENDVQEFVEEVQEPVLEAEPLMEPINEMEMPLEGTMPIYHMEAPAIQEEIPAVAAAPLPVLEQQQQPQQQQQQQQQQFFQPQPRPISEVLGTGTFYFLQDSELDSPEQAPQINNPTAINAAAIPSQTFTNQNFVSMPDNVPRQAPIAGFVAQQANPPPPIPMPPSHLSGMEFAAVVPGMGYPGYPQQAVQDDIQQVPQQQHPVVASETIVRNGGDDMIKPDDSSNGSPKNGPRPPRNNNQRRNGPPGGGRGGGGEHGGRPDDGYRQSYYNNNGYSNQNNRQRPGRGGGSRPGGNRPPTQNTQNKPKQAAQH